MHAVVKDRHDEWYGHLVYIDDKHGKWYYCYKLVNGQISYDHYFGYTKGQLLIIKES